MIRKKNISEGVKAPDTVGALHIGGGVFVADR
jgi:hypothetical protein